MATVRCRRRGGAVRQHHLPSSASAYYVRVSTACPLTAPSNVAIERIMGGFDELTVPNDFHDGVPAQYTRLVTFGNEATTVAQRLFERAGTMSNSNGGSPLSTPATRG